MGKFLQKSIKSWWLLVRVPSPLTPEGFQWASGAGILYRWRPWPLQCVATEVHWPVWCSRNHLFNVIAILCSAFENTLLCVWKYFALSLEYFAMPLEILSSEKYSVLLLKLFCSKECTALDQCKPLIQRDHNALSALEASQISPKLPALTAPINSDQINYATWSENQYSNVRRSQNLSDKFRRLSICAQ